MVFTNSVHCWGHKVEKILKDSLDWILSPSLSVKIQIMAGKVCIRFKVETLQCIVGSCQQTFENKKFVDFTQQFFCLITSSKLSCQ